MLQKRRKDCSEISQIALRAQFKRMSGIITAIITSKADASDVKMFKTHFPADNKPIPRDASGYTDPLHCIGNSGVGRRLSVIGITGSNR